MEYQITVIAVDGKFMFSTEWDVDTAQVARNAAMLYEAFTPATVTVSTRSRAEKIVSAERFVRGAEIFGFPPRKGG